ncbi:MAG: CBS domain-containing protein [Myxococcales bacterium]|nr:CBS domain-containing protein [Myxococcales bacterium]
MLRKVLIANRAEIALRVIRACRDLGVSSVAVYSEADAGAAHVRAADAAVPIGKAPATESYLRVDRIIAAARQSGADGIHPGYGFLSENPALARATADAGLTFIGPPADVIAKLGSKLETRRLMLQAGVPVLPGSEVFTDLEYARGQAESLGYPLLVKPSEGGGGRGMRLVRKAEELEAAVEASRRETLQSFGNSDVYLEKLLSDARHVEVQILADQHGNTIHVGDRDCSLQRRHQKLVEEAPAPGLSPAQHKKVRELAVHAARAAGYVNAGTVEFLYDGDGSFYLLEVNTRIQVEHCVTEAVTGLDLVAEQIRIASGLPLSVQQKDVELRGSAIETRIYAEDPAKRFFPSPGRIRSARFPSGPWVREDRGYEVGDEVTPFYDGMISKLIVWGPDRATATRRMERALGEYAFEGITTNVGFLRELVGSRAFAELDFDTGYVERHIAGQGAPRALAATVDLLAARVGQHMTPVAHAVAKSTTLEEVEREMSMRGVSGLLVVEDSGIAVGVITRSDLLRAGLMDEPGHGRFELSEELVAVDIYRGELVGISQFATLREAVALMVERGVHRLMVKQDKDAVGVLSMSDLLPVVAASPSGKSIGPLASSTIIAVDADESIEAATRRLVDSGVHGLPVMRDGAVVGTFTQREALAAVAGGAATVEGWMQRSSLRLSGTIGIGHAAREMLATRAPLIVIVADGDHKGVVTTTDLVRALL